MRLWNTQTEQEEHVAAAQAESALRATNPDGSPLYLPSVAARYPVQLSDGRLGTVLGTELLPVLQDGGRLSDWLSLDREKRRAKAEVLLPTLRTMGRAALSGLTLGLGVETDPERLEAEALAAEQQGDITTGERLRQRAAEHRASPVLGGVAEVGGMLAPALATGGGSLLGTALRVTPTGLALRAGQAAGRAVLGEGATAAARIGAGAGASRRASGELLRRPGTRRRTPRRCSTAAWPVRRWARASARRCPPRGPGCARAGGCLGRCGPQTSKRWRQRRLGVRQAGWASWCLARSGWRPGSPPKNRRCSARHGSRSATSCVRRRRSAIRLRATSPRTSPRSSKRACP